MVTNAKQNSGDYNHFLNSGTKNFEALYQRQINEFWQDIQVGHWKCSEKDVW